jgi:N-acetylmuramoyl-L-alanine amidase
MGNFIKRIPNKKALDAIKALINYGLKNGFIKDSYALKGHRNVGTTECPGEAFYNEIKNWPHFI